MGVVVRAREQGRGPVGACACGREGGEAERKDNGKIAGKRGKGGEECVRKGGKKGKSVEENEGIGRKRFGSKEW